MVPDPKREPVAFFREERDRLFASDLRGSEFCSAYSALVDRFVGGLLSQRAGVALVAVGGYGRGELCPGSDVDLLLLHHRRERRDVPALANTVWYPLWDAGLQVGHAVRTVKDAVALASGDLDTATALLDVRLVAGDADLADELRQRARDQWRSHASRWLQTLADSVAARHAVAGEVAFLLEPDLKEGRGGLRDVHALRWADAARRLLLEDDDAALVDAYSVLLAARVELQRRTGKASDRLLLQEQDGVAAALGDPDADALMARLAAAARTVAWTSDETWDRIRSSLRGPTGRVATRDRQVDAGLVLREGLVELDSSADPDHDGTLVLRAAAAAAEAGTRVGRSSLERMAGGAAPHVSRSDGAAGPLPSPWPPEARDALVRLLASGRAAVPVLEALDQKGLLVRVFPEWEPTRSRPQRNAYHRFTVDRHLCEAAAEAAGLAGRVARPDLLLMGTWLHDIGKGTPEAGDHSQVGADVVARVAHRMGFAPDDVAVLVTLVRHHLLLAETATRRDLDDPKTIEIVAGTVGDIDTLELLHALTEADGIATGPVAWTPWKAGLVSDLVARVKALLAGQAPETTTFPSASHLEIAARARALGQPVVDASGTELTIAAPDRPGLFCQVAGTLTLHNLDVLAARAWSGDDGVAVEDFRVEPLFSGELDWSAFERDLNRALGRPLWLQSRLAERARAYARRTSPKAARPPRTVVKVDNDASRTATVVEVRAPDRLGALYRITRALAEIRLDIRHAKITTLGHEVVDVFYVVDVEGDKLDGPQAVENIERAVLSELSHL